jgi:ribose/xylose/arabinose/galactoside ABC-type transport system permease subunit
MLPERTAVQGDSGRAGIAESDPAAEGTQPSRLKRFVIVAFTDHLIWILLVLIILVGMNIDGFMAWRNLLNVLWATAPLALMVLGLFLVMITRGLDLSLESTFAVAPIGALLLLAAFLPGAINTVTAVGTTLLLGLGVGLLNGYISVRLAVNPFLVTLATLIAFRGVVIWLIPEGLYTIPAGFEFLGGTRIAGVPLAILVFLGVYAVAYVLVSHTPFGRDLYAIGNNERAAYIAGVNVKRAKALTFILAGGFAGLGGLLEAGRLTAVVADMGEGDILMVFAAAILGGTSLAGGVGRVSGIFGAVLVLGIIENLMNLFGVPPAVRQVTFGAILLASIIIASFQQRLRARFG